MTEGLVYYADLIRQYHKALDLMSAAAVADLDSKLADALVYAEALSPIVQAGETLLDLGSGVGLPGIPIALSFPDNPVLLVERRQRRANFLRIVAAKLELKNVTVIPEDVQRIDTERVAYITALAVGSFSLLYCLTRHLHAPRVTLLSRKGETWQEEVAALETALGSPDLVSRETPLAGHGRLIAISLPGGLPCPSSV